MTSSLQSLELQKASLKKEAFRSFKLSNSNGYSAVFLSHGATLTHFYAPDKSGEIDDLLLGYDHLKGWQDDQHFMNACVGRVANRISKGSFPLANTFYQVEQNSQEHCLHSGDDSPLHKVNWQASLLQEPHRVGVKFTHFSPHDTGGFPGGLRITLYYWLTEENELIWEAKASCDRPSVINLASHSYWNLNGQSESSILDHHLQLHATHYLPTHHEGIPTGEAKAVAGSAMDFLQSRNIQEALNHNDPQLLASNGFDHTWIVKGPIHTLRPVAKLTHPESGRCMELLSNQPGVHFYSGNSLAGISGKENVLYRKHQGLCLETQNFPDALNQNQFPSAALLPGQEYSHLMIHRFSVES